MSGVRQFSNDASHKRSSAAAALDVASRRKPPNDVLTIQSITRRLIDPCPSTLAPLDTPCAACVPRTKKTPWKKSGVFFEGAPDVTSDGVFQELPLLRKLVHAVKTIVRRDVYRG